MGADLHSIPSSLAECGGSRGRIARVETTGDVGRGDYWHQLGIKRTAFAKVAVQINLHKSE
jgi:hypothetical protein